MGLESGVDFTWWEGATGGAPQPGSQRRAGAGDAGLLAGGKYVGRVPGGYPRVLAATNNDSRNWSGTRGRGGPAGAGAWCLWRRALRRLLAGCCLLAAPPGPQGRRACCCCCLLLVVVVARSRPFPFFRPPLRCLLAALLSGRRRRSSRSGRHRWHTPCSTAHTHHTPAAPAAAAHAPARRQAHGALPPCRLPAPAPARRPAASCCRRGVATSRL